MGLDVVSKASDDCVLIGNFMCSALCSLQTMSPSITVHALWEAGQAATSIVLIFIRQVVPHGFSVGLPDLKTPVEVLGDLPLGLHQGRAG